MHPELCKPKIIHVLPHCIIQLSHSEVNKSYVPYPYLISDINSQCKSCSAFTVTIPSLDIFLCSEHAVSPHKCCTPHLELREKKISLISIYMSTNTIAKSQIKCMINNNTCCNTRMELCKGNRHSQRTFAIITHSIILYMNNRYGQKMEGSTERTSCL